MRTLHTACFYRNVNGCAQFLAALFTCPLQDLSLFFFVLLFVLNLPFHIRILFSDMGNNKPTDKLVVQKVFEMHAAGDSAAKIARSYRKCLGIISKTSFKHGCLRIWTSSTDLFKKPSKKSSRLNTARSFTIRYRKD